MSSSHPQQHSAHHSGLSSSDSFTKYVDEHLTDMPEIQSVTLEDLFAEQSLDTEACLLYSGHFNNDEGWNG